MKPSRTYGALELALRYSYLDLNSFPTLFGGREENITLAFNWYLNNYVRFMTNYVFANNDEYADDDGDLIGNDDINIFQIRMQISF
jgi:phosphate-selective porin OprO/OprP